MVKMEPLRILPGAAVFVALNFLLTVSSLSIAAPACQGFKGILKYEIGKSYFYHYESHFEGFTYNGRAYFNPNPTMKINGTVVLTFSTECDILLNIQDMAVTSHVTANGAPTGTIKLEKSFMKFYFNRGLVEHVNINPAEPAWTQNIKRGILSMFQNSAIFTKHFKTIEPSIYGNCETTYTGDAGTRTINLTKCSQGEGSDLIFQGIPYEYPNVQNKQIFGSLRPALFSKCHQLLKDGILTESSCAESGSGIFGMTGMEGSLKYTHNAKNTTIASELAHLTQSSSIFYNFTDSFPAEKDSKNSDQIKELLKSLKLDGSNKAEVFIQLKKLIRRATNLEQFSKSELLKDEIHQKTFYDAMAEVATDESIKFLAKHSKDGGLDLMTQLKFYTTIAFATKPGPSALTAMSGLVKSIPKFVGSQPKKPEEHEEFNSKVSVAQHMLLGASGLAFQFCKNNWNCITRPEYAQLVNDITDQLNVKSILEGKKVEGTEELILAALQSLGNLNNLTPKATKAIDSILTGDKTKTPDWLMIQGLEAFRRDNCRSELKKSARALLEDKSRSGPVKISAYLALSRCLIGEDATSIHKTLKENTEVASFIASHVRSINSSSSPSKLMLKSPFTQITVPETVKSAMMFSPASQFLEYSAFSEKENLGISAESTIFFDSKESKPQFISLGVTFDIFGRSFHILEVGLSQRFLPKAAKSGGPYADWCCFEEAIKSKDSYIRVFGTTIALGLESLQDTVQTTLVQMMKGQSTSWNFNAIMPSTYLDEELTFPSLMGLPLTFDLDAVEFDSIKIELTPGKKEKDIQALMSDLFKMPYDYKVKIHTEVAFVAQGGLALGTNTPMAVGHRVQGKLDHKSTFGLEMASGEKSLLDFKIDFPETIIDSREVNGEGFSYQEVNGVVKKMRELDPKHPIKRGKNHTMCADCMLTGLTGCKSWLMDHDNILYKSTLQKSDPKMQGIEALVKSDGKQGYKLSFLTPGSTVPRELNLAYSQTHGAAAKSEVMKVVADAQLGKMKHQGAVTLEITKPAAAGPDILMPADYAFFAEYSKTIVAKIKFTQPAKGKVHMTLDVVGILSGEANVTIDGHGPTHFHSDVEVKVPPKSLELSLSDDLKFNKDEIKQVMKQIITDTKSHKKITTDTTVVVNTKQLSIQIDGSTTETTKAVKLLGKFHGDVKLAEHPLSGRTVAAISYELEGVGTYRGSLNQTNALTKDAFTSNLAIHFIPPKSKPYSYDSKLSCDWKNTNPALYDWRYHVAVEKEFKGVFLAPFDVVIKEDFSLHKKKGKLIYAAHLYSNMSSQGILARKTELLLHMTEQPGNKYTADLSGFTDDTIYRDNITSTLTYLVVTPKLQTTNFTANVDRVNMKGELRHIFAESVNSSFLQKSMTDFEYLETGRIKIRSDNEIDWTQDVKLHSKELRLFQEVKEMRGHMTYDTKFYLDISARLLQDKGHTTLGLTSKSSTPKHLAQTFNVTLSR